MNIKLLTKHHLEFVSLKEAAQAIHVKMPHCWKSHVAAQFNVIKGGEGRAPVGWFEVCHCGIS